MFVIRNFTWAIECFMIIMCLHTVNGQKLRFDWKMLGIILGNNVLFGLAFLGIIPKVCAYGMYVVLFLYGKRVFGKKVLETAGRFLVGILLSGIVETVAGFLVLCVNVFENQLTLRTFVSCAIALIIAVIIYFESISLKKFDIKVNDNKMITIVIICIVGLLALVALVVDFWLYNTINMILASILWILGFCVLAYFNALQNKRRELELRDLELNLHKMYGGVYEELIKDVRRHQHEYKNQLATLYSMNFVATGAEELEGMQNQYASKLEQNCKFDHILTCCNNSILAGYLYYKCQMFDKECFNINYKISINQAECKMPLHEIIEILGVLLDNAVEYLKSNNQFHKCIKLRVLEDSEKLKIEVGNPAEFFTSDIIELIFVEGYSTKGENRGIGLHRVKQLTDKYEAKLMVNNQRYEEQNWIEFHITIDK